MKNYKILIVVFLVFLCVVGWYQIVTNDIASESKYTECIALAGAESKKGLYQEANEDYKTALSNKSTPDGWEKYFQNYCAYYEHEKTSNVRSAFLGMLDSACSKCPQNTAFWCKNISLCLEKEDYAAAKKYLNQAQGKCKANDEFTALSYKVNYAFSTNYTQYTNYTGLSNNFYSVYNYSGYSILSSKGKTQSDSDKEYSYAGPVGENNTFVATTSTKENELVDVDGVVRGLLKIPVHKAGVYSGGLVAIQSTEGGTFDFYNKDGTKVFGGFENAGAFYDGKAAVCQNGKWGVIDTKGKFIVESKYDDIKLSADGSYSNGSIVVAKENGSYHIYNDKFNKIGSINCEDMDIATKDKLIAFKQNGKWGFIDAKGNIKIKTQYENAKSFSNGLAGVCENGLWGFIDGNNNLVIKPQFTGVDYFNKDNGCFISNKDKLYQIISLYFN